MASTDFLEARSLAKRGVVEQQVDDTGVAIRIRHTASVAITSVTLTSATDLVLIDADGTTTVTFSGVATLGLVVDAINAAANWEAIILDAKRSDASASTLLPNSSVTASTYDGVLYYDLLADTSGIDAMAVRLIHSRHTPQNKPTAGSHRVSLKEVIYNVTCGGGADTNGIKFYEVDGSTETEIWRSTPTSGSQTSVFSNAMLYGPAKITSLDGQEILVQITDGTSITGMVHVIGELE